MKAPFSRSPGSQKGEDAVQEPRPGRASWTRHQAARPEAAKPPPLGGPRAAGKWLHSGAVPAAPEREGRPQKLVKRFSAISESALADCLGFSAAFD